MDWNRMGHIKVRSNVGVGLSPAPASILSLAESYRGVSRKAITTEDTEKSRSDNHGEHGEIPLNIPVFPVVNAFAVFSSLLRVLRGYRFSGDSAVTLRKRENVRRGGAQAYPCGTSGLS